ncbi:hypothetical protein PITCH_A780056 [uncultured Desulfobacterium sp.]|uniref:Glycoside hydrolase family 42 N-terminal domain-containing protein n=1 Tax=uncultured Desulfobacterium sp. TaxID=201089 RepID=A0A445N2L7_9BACT|nr:hypothetical protein PITCH_A780056 [uncultured Desulfobacterium sp.]
MMISATYICPVRGLAGLEPPEPDVLEKAARIARSLGIEQLRIPVLEESLTGSVRHKVAFLDGLVQALDHVLDAGCGVSLIAPAQRILGLDFTPPFLAAGSIDSRAARIFVEGRLRNLGSYQWWSDPSLVQRRIRLFRELVSAVAGHPAIRGWIVMDRVLEWPRPEPQVADLVLNAYCAEIKDRDETCPIFLSIGVSEFLAPGILSIIAGQADGLCLRGLEGDFNRFYKPLNPANEIFVSAYLCALAKFFFGSQAEVEIGWSMTADMGDMEEAIRAAMHLVDQGASGINWLSLIDPENRLKSTPPWGLVPGLERIGILDQGLEPKQNFEPWLKAIQRYEQKPTRTDFIDISRKDYVSDPDMHFSRLWGHFQESFR